MIRQLRNALALLVACAALVQAQGVVVRTFILQNLSPEDAAALIAPYVDYTESGGVFRAQAVRGVTVRAMPAIMARVDSLLKASDKPRTSVRLTFVAVAANDTTAPADPALGGIEGELRSVLRFNSYKVLAQGIITTEDDRAFELALGGGTQGFRLSAYTQSIEPGGKGSVRLNLNLQGWPWSAGRDGRQVGVPIISTGLSVPFGQSVVVGSGSTTLFDSQSGHPRPQAILLVVRADPIVAKP